MTLRIQTEYIVIMSNENLAESNMEKLLFSQSVVLQVLQETP